MGEMDADGCATLDESEPAKPRRPDHPAQPAYGISRSAGYGISRSAGAPVVDIDMDIAPGHWQQGQVTVNRNRHETRLADGGGSAGSIRL